MKKLELLNRMRACLESPSLGAEERDIIEQARAMLSGEEPSKTLVVNEYIQTLDGATIVYRLYGHFWHWEFWFDRDSHNYAGNADTIQQAEIDANKKLVELREAPLPTHGPWVKKGDVWYATFAGYACEVSEEGDMWLWSVESQSLRSYIGSMDAAMKRAERVAMALMESEA